jgi:phenylacetate-coenzyme A ligase PaaK-like adenylate-forming protein
MFESLVRSNLSRLQPLYDRCPSPARHALTTARGWLLTQIRYSPETLVFLRELGGNESWTPAQIPSHQLTALNRTLHSALGSVPFYTRYPRIEIREFDDLRQFTILTREMVLQNQDRLLAQNIPPRRRIRAGTTGTTGASLTVAYTEALARKNWAFLLRQWAWARVSPRTPRVTLHGARVVPASRRRPPFWTYNIPERQTLLSVFHLSEKAAPAYIEFLRRQGGNVLEGFPSALGILADFVLAGGAPIPMRVAFTSGEPLYPLVRAKIERAFACRVFDSYGMTEYCGLIQECERGQMHLAPEYGYLEILDESGTPVAPGEEGFFVWTGFLNDAMPLIRYRIGDRGRWLDRGLCTCGRAFPLVTPTITRESDVLRCPDGRLFSPRALNQFLKQVTSLRFCQFVHAQPDRVVVRAVPSVSPGTGPSGFPSADDIMRIRMEIQRVLGPEMHVSAEIAPAPIVRPGARFR